MKYKSSNITDRGTIFKNKSATFIASVRNCIKIGIYTHYETKILIQKYQSFLLEKNFFDLSYYIV